MTQTWPGTESHSPTGCGADVASSIHTLDALDATTTENSKPTTTSSQPIGWRGRRTRSGTRRPRRRRPGSEGRQPHPPRPRVRRLGLRRSGRLRPRRCSRAISPTLVTTMTDGEPRRADHRRPQPDRHVRGLHRVAHDRAQLVAQRVQRHLVAQPRAERLDRVRGVVRAAVEAAIDERLDARRARAGTTPRRPASTPRSPGPTTG